MASVRRRTWKTGSGETKAAWVVDYADNRGDRQRKHFLQKKTADAFRIHIEGQMQTGTYRPDADKVTVKDVCESFLEHCTGRNERDERMTRKMLMVYKGHVSNHILHADHGLGSRKLSQLTARSVGDFRDQLRSVGVTVPPRERYWRRSTVLSHMQFHRIGWRPTRPMGSGLSVRVTKAQKKSSRRRKRTCEQY